MKHVASALLAGALVIASAALASPAAAHVYLKAGTPAANATVAAPKRIMLHMSEKIMASFSGFSVSKQSKPVPLKVVIATDQMVGTVARRLSPGVYMVKWHAVGADTHRLEGSYTFTVR